MPDWNLEKGIEVPSATPTGDAGTKLKANFERLRNELPFNAGSDPDSGHDVNIGFFAGSLWLNTSSQVMFVCTDASAGSAVWRSLYKRTATALILCPGNGGSGSGQRGLQLSSDGALATDAINLKTDNFRGGAFGARSFIAGGKMNAAYGACSHVSGLWNTSYGDYSHAEGGKTGAGVAGHSEGGTYSVAGVAAHSEGTYSYAAGKGSHSQGFADAAGNDNIVASGDGSDAAGGADYTGAITASGHGAHAGGYAAHGGFWFNLARITASGAGSHAHGYSSGSSENLLASDKGSHAEGRKSTASGPYAHAEGWQTTAGTSAASHAEGRGTTASGACSHAEGWNNTASGAYSHAAGCDSVASFIAQQATAGTKFSAAADAQYTRFIMRVETNNNSWTEMITPEKFDGLTSGKSYACTVTIHARQNTGENHALYKRMVIIRRNVSGSPQVQLAGTVQSIATIATNGSWAIDIGADDTAKGLKIQVQGATSQNVRWVAVIESVEIKT